MSKLPEWFYVLMERGVIALESIAEQPARRDDPRLCARPGCKLHAEDESAICSDHAWIERGEEL